jgi:molecular chaperone GrpE (heat shock protein)
MTMNAAKTAATPAKKVAKKDAAAAPVAAAPAPAVSAAVTEPKAAKAKKAATAPAAPAAPVVVASTPVETVAADAALTATPVTTLDEDLKTVTASLTTLRDTAAALLAQVKKLDKRVHREIKDARKRKRRSKTEEGADAKPRTPSIFERPVQVTDELCVFLGKAKGTQMSRSEVTKGVNQYVKDKSLKDKHDIKPDAALKKLLALPEGTSLTYFNLQRFLNRHYVKAAPATATA